jgi:hypothetical protein
LNFQLPVEEISNATYAYLNGLVCAKFAPSGRLTRPPRPPGLDLRPGSIAEGLKQGDR